MNFLNNTILFVTAFSWSCLAEIEIPDLSRGALEAPPPCLGEQTTVPGSESQGTSCVLRIHLGVTEGCSAGWQVELQADGSAVNVSGYHELSFDLQGTAGGETFRVGLVDDEGRGSWVPLANVRIGGAATSWERVRIPLLLFDLKAADFRRIVSLSLQADRAGEVTFLIDRFVISTRDPADPWMPLGLGDPLREPPGDARDGTPLGWLRRRIGPEGFMDSADDQKPFCYTYDQALGIIAFAAAGDQETARRLLRALQDVQNEDGSFATCYDTSNHKVVVATPYSGNNAWVIMAANYYARASGDQEFVPMSIRCADWLLGLQDPASGGLRGSPVVSWFSTEHHADAFSAFRYLHEISGQDRFLQASERVKQFLLTKLYAPATDPEGRGKTEPAFWIGANDKSFVTDAQSWVTLALWGHDVDETILRGAMDWLMSSSCLQSAFWNDEVGTLTGFAWDTTTRFRNLDSTDLDESAYPSRNVWFEGNEGVVAALRVIGRTEEAAFYHAQTAKVMTRAGGIPYSTYHPDVQQRSNPHPAVASTAWYVFNELGINPYAPSPTAH